MLSCKSSRSIANGPSIVAIGVEPFALSADKHEKSPLSDNSPSFFTNFFKLDLLGLQTVITSKSVLNSIYLRYLIAEFSFIAILSFTSITKQQRLRSLVALTNIRLQR